MQESPQRASKSIDFLQVHLTISLLRENSNPRKKNRRTIETRLFFFKQYISLIGIKYQLTKAFGSIAQVFNLPSHC